MSRKRMAAVNLFSNSIPTVYLQAYPYEYYRPGCYNIPQVVSPVTPFTYTYSDHWQPFCNTATYVVDRYGNVNYPSDFECQLHVPITSFMLPQSREVCYRYYDNGEAEIATLPQISEEDYAEEQEIISRKRKRLSALKNSNRKKFKQSIYRSNEGYLVEEPNDNVLESV